MGGYPPVYPPAPPVAGAEAGHQPPATGVPRTSGKATAVLILGIVSLVLLCAALAFLPLGVIPAIIALVMASGAKREINASGGALTGLGAVKAGVICSWVTIGLTIAGMVLLVALIMMGAATESSLETTSDTLSESGVGLVGMITGMPVLLQARRRLRLSSPQLSKEI